jgi:hypothetical protein
VLGDAVDDHAVGNIEIKTSRQLPGRCRLLRYDIIEASVVEGGGPTGALPNHHRAALAGLN